MLSKKFDESKIFFDVGVGLRTTTGSRTGRRAKEIRKSIPFPARRMTMTDSQISKLEEKPMVEIMTTSCPSLMMNCGCRNYLLMHRGMQIYPIPIVL